MKGVIFSLVLFGFGISLRRDFDGSPIGVTIHWREVIDNTYDGGFSVDGGKTWVHRSNGLWCMEKRIADLYF